MPDRKAWILRSVAAVIILAGVAARLCQIDYNFDGDEVFEVSWTSGSFRQALNGALTDWPHPPLHYILLWAWLKLTGPSEIGARLLSVIASAAFLIVFWRLASRLMKPAAALFALFLCAASPFLIYYGQQARMYGLIQLFATLSLFFLLRDRDEPGTWRWPLLWGASCAALLYTQYFGALLLLPQLAAIAIYPFADRRRLLVVGILAAASILPWVVAVHLLSGIGSESPEYVGIEWLDRPGATGLVQFFVGIFGFLGPGTTRLLLGLSAVTLLPLVIRRQRRSTVGHLSLVVALAALPPVVLFFVSQYGPVSMWASRQMIGSAVFVLLLLAMGLSLHRRRIAVVLGAGFAAWIALTLPSVFPQNTKPPWRALGARLQTEFRSAVVGTEDWVVVPLQYYSRAPVRRIADYAPGECCGPKLVLVCRPDYCAQLADLRARYEQVRHETIQWTPLSWSAATLDLYVLHERR